MAADRCDMCQVEEYTVSNVIRENGDTSWFCWFCFPYAMAKMLAEQGWSVEPPKAAEVDEGLAPTEEAVPAERPARRPRVVKNAEAAPEGTADSARLETPPPGADDQRGADRLESGGRAGAKPGPPAAGA